MQFASRPVSFVSCRPSKRSSVVASMSDRNKKARVLLSNDDGIQAPGLEALAAAVSKSECCALHVCAPSGERSAQSHAITLGRYMTCYSSEVEGAAEAFAVDGTPADSVMLALHSPLFKDPTFDLVLSGINRGDNCGLHVIYSGTVGAAREAACKGLAGIAFSLDGYKAKATEDYAVCAELAVPLIQGVLGLLPGCEASCCKELSGIVLNVNFPWLPLSDVKGYYLSHQGKACVFPNFQELKEPPGPHLEEFEARTAPLRVFRNFAGEAFEDDSEGSDMWAVKRGWVSVTPITLLQNLPAAVVKDEQHHNNRILELTSAVLQAAAAATGKATSGLVLPAATSR